MQNEATRLLSVISATVEKGTASGAGIEVTYGQVYGVSGSLASVYLVGDRELALSDGSVAEPSHDFRIPSHLSVDADDFVRVSMDRRGDRWIDEVLGPQPVLKYVPQYFAVLTSVTPSSTAIQSLDLPDLEPNVATMVQLEIGIRDSTGADQNLRVHHASSEFLDMHAGAVYTSGVAGRGGFGTVGPVVVGGSNNKTIRYSVSGTTNVTIWIRVLGYWYTGEFQPEPIIGANSFTANAILRAVPVGTVFANATLATLGGNFTFSADAWLAADPLNQPDLTATPGTTNSFLTNVIPGLVQ